MKLSIVFIVMTIILSACGFHPRGTIQVAPALKNVYLKTAAPYDELTRNIEDYLKMSHITQAATPAEANTVLQILNENSAEVLTSISGTQQTRQYNLIFTVIFQLTDPNGRVILPPQTVSQRRTMTIQASQMLGSSNEATAMYKQMRRSIVFDIFNRLASQDVTALLEREP